MKIEMTKRQSTAKRNYKMEKGEKVSLRLAEYREKGRKSEEKGGRKQLEVVR